MNPWVTALAQVIFEVDRAKHGEVVDDAEWCRGALRKEHRVDSKDKLVRRMSWLEEEGDSEAARAAIGSLRDPGSDDARQAVARKYRQEIQRAGLMAWDTARLVAVARRGVVAGYLDETDAAERLLMAGYRCQRAYDSWTRFGEAYEIGLRFATGGQGNKATAAVLATLAGEATSPWRTLPWQLDLGLAGEKAKTRYRRSVCPHCGGIKSQPSRTAYVYCDFCGELCDFDFERAREGAPDRDQLRAASERCARQCQAAFERGDREAYRRAQEAYWKTYVEDSPEQLSPRVGDPAYRQALCAYMAETTTLFAFDPEAIRCDGVLLHAIGDITYVQVKGKSKAVPSTFAPVIDAFEARQARLATLFTDSGVLARHPDGMTADLQRRFDGAQFMQNWLPYLDEATVRTAAVRLGVAADYDAVAPHRRTKVPCHRCGVELEVVAGARRIMCEHCGARLDLAAAR